MKNFIQSAFNKLGYRLTKIDSIWEPAYGLEAFFPLLRNLGFAPRRVIDVGANHGHWTRTALRYFPDAHYTLVEPQDHLKSHIQDLLAAGRNITWINAGAGDTNGLFPFTIATDDYNSTFVMNADQARAAGQQQVMVPIRTLNDIVASQNAAPPEMVKIDAEGLDLQVLAGASNLLGVTDVFLVEACICSNGGPNSAAAVIDFMSRAGYRLFDITDLNRSPAQKVLWLSEFAFVRNASPLLARVTSYE